MDSLRRASIAYSKLRNELGLVGVEARLVDGKKMILPKLARQWKAENIMQMIDEVATLREQLKWGTTYIDQESGQYLISLLKHRMPVRVINTMKKVRDPKMLDRIKIMDRIEMTEFLRKLKLNGQLKFPKRPTATMRRLEEQIPYWTKHVTEAGSIDYRGPGEEPDDQVRSLMIDCFSLRGYIEGKLTGHVLGGLPNPKQDIDMIEQISNTFMSRGRRF